MHEMEVALPVAESGRFLGCLLLDELRVVAGEAESIGVFVVRSVQGSRERLLENPNMRRGMWIVAEGAFSVPNRTVVGGFLAEEGGHVRQLFTSSRPSPAMAVEAKIHRLAHQQRGTIASVRPVAGDTTTFQLQSSMHVLGVVDPIGQIIMAIETQIRRFLRQ